MEANGFYAGAWASNTSLAFYGARGELALHVGYRNDVDAFSYDFGNERYFEIDPGVNCCGEF